MSQAGAEKPCGQRATSSVTSTWFSLPGDLHRQDRFWCIDGVVAFAAADVGQLLRCMSSCAGRRLALKASQCPGGYPLIQMHPACRWRGRAGPAAGTDLRLASRQLNQMHAHAGALRVNVVGYAADVLAAEYPTLARPGLNGVGHG